MYYKLVYKLPLSTSLAAFVFTANVILPYNTVTPPRNDWRFPRGRPFHLERNRSSAVGHLRLVVLDCRNPSESHTYTTLLPSNTNPVAGRNPVHIPGACPDYCFYKEATRF